MKIKGTKFAHQGARKLKGRENLRGAKIRGAQKLKGCEKIERILKEMENKMVKGKNDEKSKKKLDVIK